MRALDMGKAVAVAPLKIGTLDVSQPSTIMSTVTYVPVARINTVVLWVLADRQAEIYIIF